MRQICNLSFCLAQKYFFRREEKPKGHILFNYPIGRRKIVFKDPKLWWPRNFGEQNRYDFKITLARDGEIIDEVCFKQGIASIKLDGEMIPLIKR